MFNFFASMILALAIVAALGTQLATTAYRNTMLPQCADCQTISRDLSRSERLHSVGVGRQERVQDSPLPGGSGVG
jgi:hypothetical protein